MRKLVSAATSLVMAATMVGAVAPVVAGAADAKRSMSLLTYKDATLPEGVSADGATVKVSADAIAAGDVTIPVGMYITATETDIVSLGADATVKSDNADVSKIKFKAYTPGQDTFFAEPHTFKKADGTEITTDKVVSFAGAYSKRGGYSAHGAYNVACAESQTDAGTDNAFVGLTWTNNGSKYSEYFGAKSDDYPLVVFDVTLPKGIAEGDYVIDFCNYMTRYKNPSCILESTTKYETYNNKNLDLNSLTITVGDAGQQSGTTTTTTTATTTTGSGATTTTTTKGGETPSVDGDVIFDFINPDSEDGYWRLDPDDGVVYVDMHVKTKNATIKPTAFSCVLDLPDGFEMDVETNSPAFACVIQKNRTEKAFSGICKGPDDHGTVITEDENVGALLTITVPEGTPDGLYKISLSKAEVNEDAKVGEGEKLYKTGVIPGYIAIGDVQTTATTASSATTTTTTTSGSATTKATTTTIATTGSGTTTTTTTGGATGTPHYGDTNCDGFVRINDVVLLNKYLNDNKSYAISAQGKLNADCYKPQGGKELTAEDSDAIIKSIVHLVTLPVEK